MRMENTYQVKNIIDKVLYPEKKFPRSLFPNLITILTALYRDKEKIISSENIGLIIEGPEGIEERVCKIVGLKALLNNDPGTLVLIYRDLMYKYIFKRHTNKDEVEEIVQEIITRLLKNKIKSIRKRFNFDDPALPTFTSYFLVTIRNIYIDIIRKESRGKNLVDNNMEIENYGDNKKSNMLNALVLEEEFRKFDALLKLYHETGSKLNLTLKIKYNIPIDDADILSYFPNCTSHEKKLFSRNKGYFTKNTKSMEKITPVFNKYEKKSNNPDTLRKWTSSKLEEIKRQMNRIHTGSPYNNSTISDLVILYYKWKKKRGE